MAAPLVILVAQARAAGVVIARGTESALTLRAPRAAAALARQIRARDADVLKLYDWSHAPVSESAPCVLCLQPSVLRDPAEGTPCHKVCCDPLMRAAARDCAAA